MSKYIPSGRPRGRPRKNLRTGEWLRGFLDFCGYLQISSKESGLVALRPYGSQLEFLKQVSEGLDRGLRYFVCLKARQLGITTVNLAIDLFWLFTHPGLQGALVTDTDQNREAFRATLTSYMASLPSSHKVGVVAHNRTHLRLRNGSILHYIVAGVSGRSSMARGRGLNFLHATECSSWKDVEGFSSLMASLAVHSPDRLYIFESTARSFNLFYDIYQEARDAPDKKAFFISWAHKEDNALEKDDPRFDAYFGEGWTEGEAEKARALLDEHGIMCTDEQLAWYRMTARSLVENGLGLAEQEFPWTASDAFITTGSIFFPYDVLTNARNKAEKRLFKAYRYMLGGDWLATKLLQQGTAKGAELKIWEEPSPEGVYAVGVDPAGGNLLSSPQARYRDRFAIQILRCYADRVVQVAEYCSADASPFQFTWALAHLCGAYRNCRVVIEVNGVGMAVVQELNNLRDQIAAGLLSKRADEMGLNDILDDMAWYLYHRPDSLSGGYLWHWKTNEDNKRAIMLQLRDGLIQGSLVVNSVQACDEMKNVTYMDGSIGAEGRAHDDRVFALALANKVWIDWIRTALSMEGKTYESEKAREALAQNKGPAGLIPYIVQDYFEQKKQEREDAAKQADYGPYQASDYY